MSDTPNGIPVPASGVTPPQAHNLPAQVLLDAVPPQFPGGVELVLMRPGALEPAGTLIIPEGTILMYVPAEHSHQLRAAMHAQMAAVRKLQHDLGRRS